MSYSLIDSGDQQKLERFGAFTLIRPCSQAIWKPSLKKWVADATFSRDEGNRWEYKRPLPKDWVVDIENIRFKVAPTDFGHLGIFPEHSLLFSSMKKLLISRKEPRVLNLFAYSGGATLACAQAGAKVCHVDASKGMISWARENAELNHLLHKPIRWIIEDVKKFLKKEIKRGSFYEAIILDPPSFGRGNKGEIFKIENDLIELLELCKNVLSKDPLFILFTTHTPGITPVVMQNLMQQLLPEGKIEAKELLLPSENGFSIPYGSFAWWLP
ncbi:MAG: class I SAM-dependent methyltransferase [Candidatus Rhabdochlamydia sp.]